MSHTYWDEKRELYLTLGTHHYQKPIQLPVCKAVFETAVNRLSNAENFVEPILPFIYVFCERLIYINGLPSVKKGVLNNWYWAGYKRYDMFENLYQQQKSIEWVEARFGCQKSVKSTDMVFDFKTFLQDNFDSDIFFFR